MGQSLSVSLSLFNVYVLLGRGTVCPEGTVDSVDPYILNLAQSLVYSRCSIFASIEFTITTAGFMYPLLCMCRSLFWALDMYQY